jgi:dihydroorotase
MKIVIKKARVIDPFGKKDEVLDILIEEGIIKKVSKEIKEKGNFLIDAEDLIAIPGLIDIHAHLREPGREDEEDLYSGSKSALKGGFTTVCSMPNTEPAIDNPGLVKYIIEKAKEINLINILPVGTITKNREGKALSEMARMKEAGAIGFSDDGDWVEDSSLMRRAMEYARELNRVLILHCEDKNLSKGGVINEGIISIKLGLKGIPKEAEIIAITRDLELAKLTGARIHITHVSCKESLKLIKEAKEEGLKVTCDTCPHYLWFTEDNVLNYDTNFKINPPLRTEEDRKALIKGLINGVIDCIATDHAPHSSEEKDCEFEQASFGIIGFETALGLMFKLAEENNMDILKIIEKLTLNPAQIIGLENKGAIEEGYIADIILIDEKQGYEVKKEELLSKSKNTPFIGWELKPKVKYAFVRGGIKISDFKFKEVK